jgi:hypothetical protein
MYDEDTEVLVRHINKEALAELMKKADKAAKKLGGKESILYDIFLGRAAVLSWRKKDEHTAPGFLTPDGSPLQFTDDNRDKLMRHVREFSSFVFNVATSSESFLDKESSDVELEDLSGLESLIGGDTDVKN